MSGGPLSRRVARCLAAGLLVAPGALAGEGPVREGPAHRPPSQGACMSERWQRDIWPSLDEVTFQPTTPEERAAFQRLIPALLEATTRQRQPPGELVALARSAGFRLEVWTEFRDTVWALLEEPGKRRGAGAYLFRAGPATEDFIQAPHVYFDRGTERLGLALFSCAPEGRRPRAFATNTAHRYRSREGELREDAEHPADVAHNPEHLFQLVTELTARALPALRVSQVHGFAENGPPERKGLIAVVSAGSATPTPWTRQVARRLVVLLGEGARLYPEQTKLLGGTRNVQERLLTGFPRASFLHLELSAQARRDLTAPEKLERLGAALLAPLEE